ncbi:MAG: DUF222 domain-containing protein [Candidatus Nanopelagicaceae bacterium]
MHENANRLLREDRVREILAAPASITSLVDLHGIDVDSLSKPSKLDYLAALQKQMGFLQEWSNRVMVSLAGAEEIDPYQSEDFRLIEDEDREEIAAALRVAPATAQMKLDAARMLANHLPATAEALASGEISPAHATVIARETERAVRAGLNPESIREIENRAVAHAELHTPGQVANKVKALIAKISPEEFEEAVEAAIEQRKVDFYPESDGMTTVVALLPAADAIALRNVLDAMAQMSLQNEKTGSHQGSSNSTSDNQASEKSDISELSNGAETSKVRVTRKEFARSMDNRRADALAEIASKALADLAAFYKPQRKAVTVNITMDLPTALGLAENPAMLSDYGPIPASIARELAADGKWRRFVVDPVSGALMDYGRETYEPPQVLREFLLARDRICRFPGCRRPGHLTDIDHSQSWESGGETNPTNLGLLCRRHHRMKTHGGWKIESHADGSCTWTSPQGKVHKVPARPIDEIA